MVKLSHSEQETNRHGQHFFIYGGGGSGGGIRLGAFSWGGDGDGGSGDVSITGCCPTSETAALDTDTLKHSKGQLKLVRLTCFKHPAGYMKKTRTAVTRRPWMDETSNSGVTF